MALQEEIQGIKKQMGQIDKVLSNLQYYIEEKRKEATATLVHQLVTKAQKLAISARSLPLQVGLRDDTERLIEDLKESFDIQISITREGWVKVKMPSILPRSGKTARFIRQPLQAALAEYFNGYSRENGGRFRIRNAVVAFVFFYARDIPTERCCDIDNIGNAEVKGVLDDVVAFTIPDDGPFQLYHFYMGARAVESFTEVHIIPQSEFEEWYRRTVADQSPP